MKSARTITISDKKSCWLRVKFGDSLILRNGYVISKVYANQSVTLAELQDNIQNNFPEIPADMLHLIIENWRGGHFTDILFKS